MEKIALIVAGGSGIRMGTTELKQFITICGKPVLMHTIQNFTAWDPSLQVFLILPPSHHEYWKKLCKTYRFDIPHVIASGGDTRFQSVKNGLHMIPDEGIVFIHDGVRPLVSHETLRRCYDTALKSGNAIPSIPVNESVRQVEKNRSFPVDRSKLVLIQTPQTFQIPLIKNAYKQNFSDEFTDDASVLEKSGIPIYLVGGNRENIKITWPEDLLVAAKYIEYY